MAAAATEDQLRVNFGDTGYSFREMFIRGDYAFFGFYDPWDSLISTKKFKIRIGSPMHSELVAAMRPPKPEVVLNVLPRCFKSGSNDIPKFAIDLLAYMNRKKDTRSPLRIAFGETGYLLVEGSDGTGRFKLSIQAPHPRGTIPGVSFYPVDGDMHMALFSAMKESNLDGVTEVLDDNLHLLPRTTQTHYTNIRGLMRGEASIDDVQDAADELSSVVAIACLSVSDDNEDEIEHSYGK